MKANVGKVKRGEFLMSLYLDPGDKYGVSLFLTEAEVVDLITELAKAVGSREEVPA